MKVSGVREESRNGPVLTIQEPVLITHACPWERVMFIPSREENPYFHLMECVWMMAGSRDAKWISTYNPRMMEFAEPTGIFNGAYGWRWRNAFHIDQVLEICSELSTYPTSRRAVLQMWACQQDLNVPHVKDVPCNTHAYFRIINGSLDMTVCNRSNDLVWGALGSNVVHFSFLQELMAHEIGVGVGKMYQFTNNLHLYERHWHFLDIPPHGEDYKEIGAKCIPIIKGGIENWMIDAQSFVDGGDDFTEPFFKNVLSPLRYSWHSKTLPQIPDCDWKIACDRYMARHRG
jgi:hypothetical protein